MRDKIQSALKELEAQHHCRFLFAAESGSRAWGFASPDSDYDVRAIYVKPVDWYLTINIAPKDTIEAMLPGDLDISAWELRKTLRLFAGCNLALCEWLTSPMQYSARPDFLRTMQELMPQCFNPIKATHHYLALARQSHDTLDGNGAISIKKLFYMLRGILAARWCCRFQNMPPVLFSELLLPELLPDHLKGMVTELLLQKQEAREGARLVIPEAIQSFYEQTCSECPRLACNLTPKHLPEETFDNLLQTMVHSTIF